MCPPPYPSRSQFSHSVSSLLNRGSAISRFSPAPHPSLFVSLSLSHSLTLPLSLSSPPSLAPSLFISLSPSPSPSLPLTLSRSSFLPPSRSLLYSPSPSPILTVSRVLCVLQHVRIDALGGAPDVEAAAGADADAHGPPRDPRRVGRHVPEGRQGQVERARRKDEGREREKVMERDSSPSFGSDSRSKPD